MHFAYSEPYNPGQEARGGDERRRNRIPFSYFSTEKRLGLIDVDRTGIVGVQIREIQVFGAWSSRNWHIVHAVPSCHKAALCICAMRCLIPVSATPLVNSASPGTGDRT